MSLEYFIAKRLVSSKSYKSSISSPIIKIAVIAIALSIVMMIISIATGIGLQNKIKQNISLLNGHILVSNFDNNNSQVSVVPIDRDIIFNGIKRNKFITHYQSIALKAGLIRTENVTETVIYKGIDGQFNKNFQNFLVAGKIPNYASEISNEVIISKFLSDKLELSLNQSFNTFFVKEGTQLPKVRKLKIVGIFSTGIQEFDANHIIGDIRHIQRINKWKANQVGSVEIFTDDISKITEYSNEVYKSIPPIYNSISISDKYANIFEWLKIFDFNIYVILIIMIFVSVINMIVALLVLILEKTQLIGILKAIGANNWSIRKIFLYNAFHLISKGLLWGNLLALLLLYLQKYFHIVRLDPTNYYVNVAPVDINYLNILGINLLTILVCLLVLIVPSYLITKVSPVKAIRFE